jgi:hypothetical protein
MVDVAKEKKGFNMLLITLLAFNTFFIGNIWWILQNGTGSGGCPMCPKTCLMSQKMAGGQKLCPITKKPL